MARYIDANALLEQVSKKKSEVGKARYTDGFNDAILRVRSMISNAPTADVVPKSKEGAECPTCHGTGRIGTTDWLTKGISKKQLAEEKAKAVAEHYQHIKSEVARDIISEFKTLVKSHMLKLGIYPVALNRTLELAEKKLTEKYTEDKK